VDAGSGLGVRSRLFIHPEQAHTSGMPRVELLRDLGSFRTISAVSSLLVALTTSCSGNASPRSLDSVNTTSVGDARAQLDALGEAWFRTPATITYQTTGKVPGQPASSHQCLRQLVGGAIDRRTALRMCSRQGLLKLAWDPPDRWRMDVTSPVDRFNVLSTTDGSVICPAADGDRACRPISTRAAKRASPFSFLFVRPERILDAIGATDGAVVAEPGTEVARVGVTCFAASGRRGRAEWCYSRGGLLLSFLEGAGGDLTTLEAVAVSSQVFEGDFEPPAS
jgi:hypothetical protein